MLKRLSKKAISILLMITVLLSSNVLLVSALSDMKDTNTDTDKKSVRSAASSPWEYVEPEYERADYMTSQQYKDLGFSLTKDPDLFDEEDDSNPLDGYEASILSELYMGRGGYDKDYEADAHIMENAKNYDGLSVSSLINNSLASNSSYINQDSWQYQSSVTAAIKLGKLNPNEYIPDSLIQNSIYVKNNDSCQSLVLYKYNQDSKTLEYQSQDDRTLEQDNKFVEDIEVQESAGYQAITVGDFDGDDYNEVAVYLSNSDNPIIAIYEQSEKNGKVSLVYDSSKTIELKSISTHFANTKDTNRPLVNLCTTDIAGREDLVVNVTLPYSNDDAFCHGGCTAIYSWSGNSPKMVYKDYMEYSGYRMKFTSSAAMDINGDGNNELIVASNKNTDYKDGDSRGDMCEDKNLVNVILWSNSENKYYNAWATPQEVEALDFVKKDKDRKEPVAITGTRFDGGSKKDTLFVEGIFYDFVSGGGDTVEQQIAGGRFIVRKKFTDSTGNNNTFIHLAQSASFVEDNRLTEQTLVVYGDEYSGDSDKIYLDIFWCYNDGTDIIINCTDDDYYYRKNEDDNGTFLTFCPLDVDNDTTYFQYTTKTVGWSNPQVHSVMLSVPYWSELDYGSAITARGSTYYSISTGTGSTSSNSGNLSLGASIGIEGSVGFLAKTGQGAFGVNVDFMHQYLHSFQESNTVTESIGFTAGGGDDYVALLVMPIVTYHYKTWIPEHKATQDEVDAYLESYGEVGCPKVGDTIEGYFTDMCVNVQLNPANSTVPLKTYNQVVENFNQNEKDEYKLPVIDLDELYLGRKLGDPSTYADDIEKISSIDPDAETTLVTNNEISVSINGQSTVDQSLTETYSSTTSNGYGFNIKGSMSQTAEAGVHLLIFNAEFKVKCVESLGGGFTLTWASSNTNGITYKNSYASLPDSAKTGVENGTPVSSYAFSCKLVKWEPENIGNGSEINTVDGETLKVSTAVIGSLVSGADGAPAAMPTDLHVSSTTKDTATLKWNNNTNFARKADAYKIYYSKSATGEYYPVMDNGKEVVVDGDRESYVVKGLSEKTTYYFKLQTIYNKNEVSTASILGPYASGTTKGSSNEPLIVTPPSDVYTIVGEKAEFTIEATAEYPNSTLTYKWQQLVNDGYLSEWTDIASEEAKKPTFNAAYGSKDGLVSNTTAKTLDNTVYRCIVTEHYGDNNNYSSVISRSATLHIADHVYNDNGFCIYCDQYQPAALNNGVYGIKNAGQLFWFASLVNNDHTHADFDKQDAGAKAVLVKDIDLESREWSPIRDYTGVFDGQNHTVSNLEITNTSHDTGLFRSVYGTIKNFTVKGEMIISADGDYIGGVVGYADGSTISNITSYVNISNTAGVLHHIGGVVGYIANKDTFVDKCLYYGTVDIKNSTDCIGGIVGYTNAGARISNCANHGTVTASEAGAYTGGILGYVNNSNPTIKDCYNYGKVSNGNSTQYCGAIIGWARNYTASNIDNNYYLDSSSALAFGSGSKSGAAATAKNAEQFKSGEVAYLLNHSVTDGTQVWYQNIDNGKTPDDYPLFEGGTVYYLEYKDGYSNTYSEKPELDEFDKKDGKFIIKTYDDLVKLSNLVRSDYEHYGSANYILENNIKAPADSEWTQGIGSVSDSKPFNGTFDGNGYCIIGLNIKSPEYGGLFEVIGKSGVVKNLFVFDCDFSSSSKTAGGIAAVNEGTIDHCTSGVNITSGYIYPNGNKYYAPEFNSNINGEISGGVVGENSGSLIGCRSSAVVSGTICGGIAGVNNGTIYGCANNGKVGKSTSTISGGLAGKNGGTIESSYNSATVESADEKGKGSVAGINGYDGLTPTVKSVYYITKNGLSAVGADSTKSLDNTNIEKTDNKDMQSSEFTDTLNSVTDDSVSWKHNPHLNKGYPIIEGNFFINATKSAGNNITIQGSMHKDLNIKYDLCDKNSEEYKLLSSAKGNNKILNTYSVSLTDNDGNYIPAELWCTGSYKISVPVDSKNIQLAGIDTDGNIVFCKPDSVENGTAVFTVSYPMSFAIVETTAENPSSVNNNNGTPIQTGSEMCGAILLVALLSLTVILIVKRRNKIG